MRYTNGTEIKTHRELQNDLNMSFPANSPPDGWTEYVSPPAEPNYYYSISPKSDVIAIGGTLEIAVTGEPGDYVLIIEGLAVPEQQITIDESGIETLELPAIDAGVYKIKGTGLLSQCVAKVEVF
jgi:hypothetical protein